MYQNKENLMPFVEEEIRNNKLMVIMNWINTILLIIIILFILCCSCRCDNNCVCDCGCGCCQEDIQNPTSPFNPSEDPDIEWGDRETTPPEKIQEELDKQIEEGMMNISMNTNPVFETGKSKGNLLIVNEKINRYAQVVQIYRDDTGELIYTSGAIPVGARIDESKLDVPLSAGIYECTAHFNQIDDSGNLLGKACAKISIYVLG